MQSAALLLLSVCLTANKLVLARLQVFKGTMQGPEAVYNWPDLQQMCSSVLRTGWRTSTPTLPVSHRASSARSRLMPMSSMADRKRWLTCRFTRLRSLAVRVACTCTTAQSLLLLLGQSILVPA